MKLDGLYLFKIFRTYIRTIFVSSFVSLFLNNGEKGRRDIDLLLLASARYWDMWEHRLSMCFGFICCSVFGEVTSSTDLVFSCAFCRNVGPSDISNRKLFRSFENFHICTPQVSEGVWQNDE